MCFTTYKFHHVLWSLKNCVLRLIPPALNFCTCLASGFSSWPDSSPCAMYLHIVAPGIPGVHNLGYLPQRAWDWAMPGIDRQAAWDTWLWWEDAGKWAPLSLCSLSWLFGNSIFPLQKIFPYFPSAHILVHAKWSLFSLISTLIS